MPAEPTTTPGTGRAAAAGVAGGALSGLFGVGGGIVMVPLFTFWLGLDQRRAITTSLVSIIPIALAGIIGYAWGGAVAWWMGLLIGLASVVGGQIGARLLPRVPVPVLQVSFAVLLVYSAYRLVQPDQAPADAATGTWWELLLVGVAAGVLAALLGVGGGIVIVPALVLLTGTDLTTARGTSLVVVILTAATASLTNIRAGRADVRTGTVAGLAGAPASLAAALGAQWLPLRVAALLFAVLMLVAAAQLLWRAVRARPPQADAVVPDQK